MPRAPTFLLSDLHPPDQLVDDEGVRVVVHPGAQRDAVKDLHLGALEERVVEHGGTVVTAEIEAEGILGKGKATIRVVAPPDVVTPLDPESAVHLEAAVVAGFDQLSGDRSLPGNPALGRIAGVGFLDAGRAPEVAIVGDERDYRQGTDRVGNIIEVGVGDDLGRQMAGSERRRPNHARAGDSNGRGVDQAVRAGGLASIRGVANRGPGIFRGEVQVERLTVEASRDVDVGRREETENRAVAIGAARGGVA